MIRERGVLYGVLCAGMKTWLACSDEAVIVPKEDLLRGEKKISIQTRHLQAGTLCCIMQFEKSAIRICQLTAGQSHACHVLSAATIYIRSPSNEAGNACHDVVLETTPASLALDVIQGTSFRDGFQAQMKRYRTS